MDPREVVNDVVFERDADGVLVCTCPNDADVHWGIVPDGGDLIVIVTTGLPAGDDA